MKLNRRGFLKTTLAGATVLTAGSIPFIA
ncbi:MAG: twin-arginine translocation signal domain-containing protein, partial [Bacteroidales bacterium]|nr:twin-arginine translocation signal domain-containing protein [Bacteroidales bacterium]